MIAAPMPESFTSHGFPRDLRSHIKPLAPILILAVVAFIPVFQTGFMDYDDSAYLTENTTVSGPISWSSLVWLWNHPILNLWHPLTPITLHMEYQLWGLNAGGYHAVSLLVHLANISLLYALIFMLGGSRWRAAGVALLFSVHPLRVESIAWVAQIKDVMSVFLGLWCMILYVAYARSPSRFKLGASVLCLGVSLLYKPLLVTIPAVLLLLDYYPLRRFTFSPALEKSLATPESAPAVSWQRILAEKAVYALPIIAVIARVIPSMGYNTRGNGIYAFPLWLRLQNTPISYVRYVGKMIWPFDGLVLNYPMPESWAAWMVGGSAAAMLIVTGAVVLVRNSRPMQCVGWFWYLITLFTVSGITYIGDYSIADRYTYFPTIGLAIMAVFAIPEVWWERRAGRYPLLAGAMALALIMAATTWHQLSFWRSPAVLHQHGLEIYPDDALDHVCLGILQYKAGDFKGAEQHLNHSLKFEPYNPYARLNLMMALRAMGRQDEALAQGRIAVEQAPTNTDALGKMGQVYMERGDLPEALELFDRALKIETDSPVWRVMRAGVLTKMNRDEEAADSLVEALDLAPENGPIHFNYGLILARHGQPKEAIEHFELALQKSPAEPHIEAALGMELFRTRQFEAALVHFQSALEHDPDNVSVAINAASTLGQLGNTQGALELLQKTMERHPESVPARDSLGVLLFRIGQKDQAIAQLRAAEALDPSNAARKQLLEQWTGKGPTTAP